MKIKNIRIYLTVMICVLFAGCGQTTDDTDKQEGIVFENESVREAVLEALDRTSDEEVVTKEDLEQITELEIHDPALQDISFVQDMPNLEELNLSGCGISEIDQLMECKKLNYLDLTDNQIKDYDKIERLWRVDTLRMGGNPGNFHELLCMRDADVLDATEDDKEAWKAEAEKALDVYNPDNSDKDGMRTEVEDWYMGDYDGDGIEDIGIVIGRSNPDVANYPIQRRLYVYPGNGEDYEQPMEPIPLHNGYGQMNPYLGFVIQEHKVIVRYCFESEENILYDTEMYAHEEGEWKYLLYTSLQQCQEPDGEEYFNYGIDDFEKDSFTVYIWNDEIEKKEDGEPVLRWEIPLTDCFIFYDRLLNDEGEDGYKWITLVNPYYIFPNASVSDILDLNKGVEKIAYEYSTQDVLDEIYEKYYAQYDAVKIYINQEVRDNYRQIWGVEIPEYCYRIEIDGYSCYLHFSKVHDQAYYIYTYGYDNDERTMIRSDEFIVDVHSGEIQTQLDPIGNLCATDGELALVLGVEVAEFEDDYGEEPIPSTSTPTQLIGEEVIDGELVKWFFMDYEDISIEYTNHYNNSIQSVDRPYIISGYRLRTSRFKTEKDIYVGNTLAQVEEAYGDALYQDEEDESCYHYEQGMVHTNFYIENDKVTEIYIYLVTNW